MFNYKSSTKHAYKSARIADVYDRAFTGPATWANLRFKVVAYFERRAIGALLKLVPSGRVLDIPCGTGKLAPILSPICGSITAADISPDMLRLAEAAYGNTRPKGVQFAIADAEDLVTAFGEHHFDTVVCLRLMHRVPSDTRRRMLGQMAAVSPYAIVSFGVDSMYFRFRRWLRNLLLGGGTDPLCTASRRQITAEASERFEVIQARWIAPLLSEELVCLLRRR